MDDLRALVGASVKRLRVERQLTQAQLAEKIGRSVDMVSRLERGDTAPSFETITALAVSLNAHPAELFGGKPYDDSDWQSGVSTLVQRLLTGGEDQASWLAKLIDHLDRRPKS